jgi:hypothetical protein
MGGENQQGKGYTEEEKVDKPPGFATLMKEHEG